MDKLKKLLVSFVMLSLLTLSPTSAQAVATSMDDVAEAIKDEYQEIVLGTAKEYKDSDYEIIKYEDNQNIEISTRTTTFYIEFSINK